MKQPPNFKSSFDGLSALISILLGPEGCPWDREQSFSDLKRYFLEESHELLEAIDLEDSENIKEELGDVIFNLCFMMHVAENIFQFGSEDVFGYLINKIIKRHPHVFEENQDIKIDQVVSNWEKIKSHEKGKKSLLASSAPRSLPALANSFTLQEKASRFGFDWDKINDVEDKLTEEFQELKNAENDFEKELEIGDVFFSMVNLARWHNVDPETSLRKANRRFNERLIEVERLCDERQIEIKSLSNELRDNLWIEAKNNIK